MSAIFAGQLGCADLGSTDTSDTDSGTVPKATPLRLNELLASDSTYGKDGDGNSSDWIELYSAREDPTALGNYALGDSSEDTPWSLPDDALYEYGVQFLDLAKTRSTSKEMAGRCWPTKPPRSAKHSTGEAA